MHYIQAAALHISPMLSGGRAYREVVIVVKASVESGCEGTRVENDSADKGGCLVSVLFEQLSPGGNRLGQRDAEIGNPVDAGQQAGQNAGVCGVGDGTGREGLRKANALPGDRIQRRRLDLIVAIAVDMIGA